MNLEEIASKNEFTNTVENRLTKAYTVPVHSFGVILSIAVSFCLTFLVEYEPVGNILASFLIDYPIMLNILSIGKLELINISTFIGVLFIYKFFLQGLSFGSTPFFVDYKYSPMDFLKYTYLALSFMSISISTIGLEFIREGSIEKLSPVEAFYFTTGIVSTTGSNIYPYSGITEIFTIFLSACTLFLIIFIFNKLPEIQMNRKVHFDHSRNRINYNYEIIIQLITESELTDEQKIMVFKFFLERFDFNQPNGTGKVFIDMEKGDFSFGLKVYP